MALKKTMNGGLTLMPTMRPFMRKVWSGKDSFRTCNTTQHNTFHYIGKERERESERERERERENLPYTYVVSYTSKFNYQVFFQARNSTHLIIQTPIPLINLHFPTHKSALNLFFEVKQCLIHRLNDMLMMPSWRHNTCGHKAPNKSETKNIYLW